MKKITVAFFTAVLLLSQLAYSDDNAKDEAATLLDMMGLEKALDQSIDRMLQVQLQQNPQLTPYRQVIRDFFSKYMSFESLKPEMVELYAENFTAAELQEIIAFYRTPVGQKTIEKLPDLMGRGTQIGAARVQQHLPELKQMINEEAKRLQDSQAQ